MIKFNNNWSDIEKVSYLQRRVIVYSIIYYELNNNVISDYEYDSISRQLFEYQNRCKDVEKTKYYYATHDFDGSTGFYLFHALNSEDQNWLFMIAEMVNKSCNNYKRKERESNEK